VTAAERAMLLELARFVIAFEVWGEEGMGKKSATAERLRALLRQCEAEAPCGFNQ
jgi:hypothetical protein